MVTTRPQIAGQRLTFVLETIVPILKFSYLTSGVSYAAGFTGTDCTADIDECTSSPCIYGNCTDNVNGYRCLCEAGYAGLHCESNVGECASSSCIHENCTDDVNSFHCLCDVGFSGITCSPAVSSSECSSSNCNVVRCSIFNLQLGPACYYAWASCLLSALVLATLSFCAVFIYGIKKRQRLSKEQRSPFPFEDTTLGESKKRFDFNVFRQNGYY